MILGTNQGQAKYILLHFHAEFPLKSTGEKKPIYPQRNLAVKENIEALCRTQALKYLTLTSMVLESRNVMRTEKSC